MEISYNSALSTLLRTCLGATICNVDVCVLIFWLTGLLRVILMKMPEECRVIQVTNVAPTVTKDQMKTLFGFIGKIDDVVLYPELETTLSISRVCYVKFEYPEDVGVSLHLSNTVFIDRALVVVPVPDGKIPDDKTALSAGIDSGGTKVDDVRRTIYVSNLSPSITPEHLLQLFGTQAGEVKYVRMAGDEALGSRAAFVEFTEQASVMRALALTGQTVGDCLISVAPANTAIMKPAATGMSGATSKELEQAMKKVNEAQPLISAVLDPDRRSRSRSRSHRSRSRRSRSRRHSRSRSRKRSRSRSHRSRRRSRSRSKRKSRSPKRRRSRSRSHKRPRSKSPDRRRRSKSRSPKSSKSRRSRSREKTKKTDATSHDATPAKANKDVGKRGSDEKKTSKESDKERKQSSRHRSRSPKMSSRRRSRSRSNSPSRSNRKGRDDRRRSPERSKERSDQSRSNRDDTKEPERHSNKGRNGHDGDSDRESKSSAPKRSRDADHDQESDVDGNEPKLDRNEDNTSEGDGSRTEDED